MDKTCGFCGSSLKLMRSDARFCSTKCRVYDKRRTFPKAMTDSARWVRRDDTKRPLTVTAKPASSTNRRTWSTHAAAQDSTAGTGLGFCLGDGIGAIDLDHCLDGGKLAPWAAEILGLCPDTFIEVSMSGTGLHIFGYLPEAAGRKIRRGPVAIEVYSQGRYLAVTGKRWPSSVSTLADLSDVVGKLITGSEATQRKSLQADRFAWTR